MKENHKEKSKSKSKLTSKKINNEKRQNNNPFYFPIKYFCFNEVKKIVNNKNKKSPVINKNNEKPKNINNHKTNKKEEEDDYKKSIYTKRLIISHSISLTNMINPNYASDKIEGKNNYLNYCYSADVRYKPIHKFRLNTKKILYNIKQKINKKYNIITKKNKFSRNNKKNKTIKKLSNKTQNYIDIHNITNINPNTIIYRLCNIDDSKNIITSNTINNKTITNKEINNYLISNNTPNKCFNKNNTDTNRNHKITNINNKRNKNINKSLRIKNAEKNEKDNNIFIRRFILEEKYTIDSKGDKKTIYIKKINPIIQQKNILNSADKRLIKNKNKNKIKNNNNKNKDNTFINHNDINFNFNVCYYQKININNNKKNLLKEKLESLDDDYKSNNYNEISLNDTIMQNYKDLLSIKNGNKIIYQKVNGIINNSEKSHKSFQNIFLSPNQRYAIKLNGKDYDKKKPKINKKNINNNNNIYKNNNNKNNYYIKKNSTKEFKSINIPFKYILSHPRFLKNKVIHRKMKTNVNNIDNEKIYDYYKEEENNNTINNKRSLSYIGKSTVYNLVKKLKDNKKIELKDKLFNGNNISIYDTLNKNHINKINEYFYFSPLISEIEPKDNTILNTLNNAKFKKTNKYIKTNLCLNINDSNDNSKRCNSLNKIINKNNKNYNTNEIKLFIHYLNNNMISGSNKNKSHRNFLIKKCDKYNIKNIWNKKNSNNSKMGIYSNFIYKNSKTRENLLKNKSIKY